MAQWQPGFTVHRDVGRAASAQWSVVPQRSRGRLETQHAQPLRFLSSVTIILTILSCTATSAAIPVH
jgi:hypothetical protein